MYRRLAQLEKLVENDNSSSQRPRYHIFSAWMAGSAVVDLKAHHKGILHQRAFYCFYNVEARRFVLTTGFAWVQQRGEIGDIRGQYSESISS